MLLSVESINHKIRDGRGRSILLSAIALENIPLLRVLLDYDMKKYDGYERKNNQEECSKSILSEYDGNRTYLYLACCTKNEEIVRTLLKYNPSSQINKPNLDQEKHTPLFAGVTRGDTRLCCLLLSEFNANANQTDGYGLYIY